MGKHAGVPVAEAPLQYLAWAYGAWTFTVYPELQRAIEIRLGLPHGPIRTGPAPDNRPQQPHDGPGTPRNGHDRERVGSGLDGFRQAFDRTRREPLREHQHDPIEYDLLESALARVQAALGI